MDNYENNNQNNKTPNTNVNGGNYNNTYNYNAGNGTNNGNMNNTGNGNNFSGYNAAPNNNNYGRQNNGNFNNGARGGRPQGNYNPYQQPMQQPNQKKPKTRFGLGIIVGIAIMLVVVIIAVAVINIKTRSSQQSISTDYEEKLELISEYLDAYYIGDADSQTVTDSLAAGLLAGIDDKYAQYYTAEEFQELMEETTGNYAGIGVSVALNTDKEIEVYKVFKNTPAAEAGIKVGDIITAAGGVTSFETVDDLVDVVRGEVGTSVEVTVRSSDGKENTYTIERKQIEIQTVEYEMLEDNIGYIAISEFEKATVEQFNTALSDLEGQGMTAVILDLRDNPGGDYDTVVSMADRVLPECTIMSTKDKAGNVTTEYSDEENKLDVPCVVLVNGNSASASEVFTGALKDNGVATVVGETTYGKGVVQSIFQLADGSGMKFTTEKYYTPNGTDLDGVGITPDIEVSLPDDAYDDGVLEEDEDTQLQAAIEALTVA